MGRSSGVAATEPLEGGRRQPGEEIPVVGTPPLSGYRGRPPRSCLACVKRGNPVGVHALEGVWSADREEGPAPQRAKDDPEANAGGRKAPGNRDDVRRAPTGGSRGNWSDTGIVARLERGLTGVRWACEQKVTTPSEPPDKLDAPPSAAVVNGPAGEIVEWRVIDWRVVDDSVRRLCQRGLAAPRAADSALPRAFGACLSRVLG